MELTLFVLLIIFEVLEANTQKGSSLIEILKYGYSIYKYNIFIYLSMNFTFFYALFISIYLNDFNFWLASIVVLKFLDISIKLYLFQKIEREGFSALENFIPTDIKFTTSLKYSNLMIYSSMGLFGLHII